MAESFVNVTEGSGKKLHTNTRVIGADTVHDEIVVLGEPYLASYAVHANSGIATANDHQLALMAGSSLNLRIRRIHLRQGTVAGAVGTADFDVVRLTTAGSGGTAITPAAFDSAEAAAGATCRSLPSTKGTEGTRLFRLHVGLAATYPTFHEAEWVQLPNQKPLIIPAGTANGIAVKCTVAVATTTVECRIEFDEVSF